MNFVALALLEACGGDDENAFWILAGMCENLELEVSFYGAAFHAVFSQHFEANNTTIDMLGFVFEAGSTSL